MQPQFDRDGFTVLEGFLEPGEVADLRSMVEAVLSRPLPQGCERPHNTLAPLRWNSAIVEGVVASSRRMRTLAGAIGADDLRWISSYVSVKDVASDALWWHQDWWCWDHPASYRAAAPQVAVLTYLADTTADNGALRVLPGSHHRSVGLHEVLPAAHGPEAAEIGADHVAMRDHDEQVTLEVCAGDAVVIDYRLLHGTHPNASKTRRDCLLLSFVPSWRDLPSDLRAHLIRHPALPSPEERADVGSWPPDLLPSYDGPPRDLTLDRVAPDHFQVADR